MTSSVNLYALPFMLSRVQTQSQSSIILFAAFLRLNLLILLFVIEVCFLQRNVEIKNLNCESKKTNVVQKIFKQ